MGIVRVNLEHYGNSDSKEEGDGETSREVKVINSNFILQVLNDALLNAHEAKMLLQNYNLMAQDIDDAAKLVEDISTTSQSLSGMIAQEQHRIGEEK